MANREYWYNTKTGKVEEGRQSVWTQLMGPYKTEEEARNALETAAERNESFEAEEEQWEEEWKDDWDEE